MFNRLDTGRPRYPRSRKLEESRLSAGCPVHRIYMRQRPEHYAGRKHNCIWWSHDYAALGFHILTRGNDVQ